MKNKKTLLLIALILSLTLMFMIWYAFRTLETKETQPILKNDLKPTTTNTITNKEDSNLEKIKTQMEKLNNSSLEAKQPSLEEGLQESDQAKQYEQEFIEKGEARMADGYVLEVTNSYLKVKFNSASYTWISKVNITPETSLTQINPGSENTPISLAEITVNSKVTVRTNGESITNEEITAEKVIKVN
jgi:hypothetical protein